MNTKIKKYFSEKREKNEIHINNNVTDRSSLSLIPEFIRERNISKISDN